MCAWLIVFIHSTNKVVYTNNGYGRTVFILSFFLSRLFFNSIQNQSWLKIWEIFSSLEKRKFEFCTIHRDQTNLKPEFCNVFFLFGADLRLHILNTNWLIWIFSPFDWLMVCFCFSLTDNYTHTHTNNIDLNLWIFFSSPWPSPLNVVESKATTTSQSSMFFFC